ncbi:MAG: hypothetical protein HKN75_01310 [Bacteroidia bacterium]|nr:hypothetical protein [Bacteroidia bacterium]
MKRYFLIYSTFLLTLVIASCQSTPDQGSTETENDANNKILTEIDANAPVVKLQLDAAGNTMDDMEFVQKELTVKTGSTVHLQFNNLSTDGAMQHNFVLIENGEADKVGSFAMQAGAENEFVPRMPEVLAHTKMLLPEENVLFIFRAPTPGTYMYICTYPGHYSKMQGMFIVTE